MVVVNIDGIDERFNDRPAEERIVPVAGGETVKEEQDAVPVDQLGL